MRSKETDPRRIAQRRKQIELGKTTSGYSSYTSIVPKCKRRANLAFSKHPITPDPHEKCSKRRFDGKLRVWRRGIHSFEEACESGMIGTAVVGVKNDAAPTAGPSSLFASKNLSPDDLTRVCSNQHVANAEAKAKKDVDASVKLADNTYYNGSPSAKGAVNPKSTLSVVVSGLSPTKKDVPAKRYTFAGATCVKKGANESGATAKFETPRKKIRGKSHLIRPGSSGKENFAVSRSAKKRAVLQRLQELNLGAATSNINNYAMLTNGANLYPMGTDFEKSSAPPMQMAPGGLVCTGGVCMLPDARTGAFLPHSDGVKTTGARAVLGEVCDNVAPSGIPGKASTGNTSAYDKESIRLDLPQEEARISHDKRRSLEEFLRMHDTENVGIAENTGRVRGHPLGLHNSQALPPKCARFNEGVCDIGAARCEYRHAVWTFAERVEYEARRAFSENSRILEQNSALLGRLREQDVLIADQTQEISSLLDEVHQLRHAALRRRGTTVATPSRAATIAATALRRTPLRSASSRASFRNTNAPLIPADFISRTRRNSTTTLSDASVSIIERILSENTEVQRTTAPEVSTYEMIHGIPRVAKGPHGVGFDKLA